jgi:hypothetical protein
MDPGKIAQMMAAEQEARGNKPGFLFGIFPMDWNIQTFSIQSVFAFMSNPVVKQAFINVGKTGGLGDKFFAAVQKAAEQIRQQAQNVNMANLGDLRPPPNISGGDGPGRSID